MTSAATVKLAYYTDALCVWAYVSEIRLAELRHTFGERLAVSHHYLPLFGATARRIGEGWAAKGGWAGFGDHVLAVCRDFPHVQVHPQVWRATRPVSSGSAHLVLKALQLNDPAGTLIGAVDWAIRVAFFRDNRDIGRLPVLLDVAQEAGAEPAALRQAIDDGSAMAALCRDAEMRDEMKLEGSPTWVLNQGRQKLYGNLGYRILEANVREILDRPDTGASWC